MLLFVCSEITESKTFNQDTIHTLILPPIVSLLCSIL